LAQALHALGADSDRLDELAAMLARAPAGAAVGRVSRVDRGRFQLLTGEEPVTVPTAGTSAVCVGDWCAVTRLTEDDGREEAAQLLEVLPRRTVLVRQASGSRTEPQALAANIDVIMVLLPLDRSIVPRQIERFLALAWDSGAQPVLILTKADLVDNTTASVAATAVGAVSGTLSILTASVTSGQGVDEVATLVGPGRTAAFLGTSGSGKSSMVNALMESDAVQTGAVRQSDAKGRHTTTWRELVVLPRGGALIDTPGLRELGMWIDEDGIAAAFADITDLAERCRFRDCAHASEPGCAVLAAIAAGELSAARLTSFRTLLGEASDAAQRNELRLENEERRGSKRRSRETRHKPRS
jgi:ribosome biogenesis GTPase